MAKSKPCPMEEKRYCDVCGRYTYYWQREDDRVVCSQLWKCRK